MDLPHIPALGEGMIPGLGKLFPVYAKDTIDENGVEIVLYRNGNAGASARAARPSCAPSCGVS